MTYRKDVDGLRAVAIGSVLLFHAGLGPFSGGFVGVDIFFVISGYLITSILLGEIRDDRFSLMRFYQRRILRILPALFVVLVVSLALASAFMFPNEFASTGKSLIAAALLSSNVFFWKTTNYFDGGDTLKPLLQTWSLGVEEQFYVLFPLLLLVAWKALKDRLVWAIWGLILLSFATSVYQVSHAPTTAFYMLPARMWELSLGALIAADGLPKIESKIARELIGLASILLFAVSIRFFDARTPFPGYAALGPCLGALGIIAYGESTFTGRILGAKPVVWLGLISYSLYLWHWPVLMFLRYRLGDGHPHRLAMVAGLAASLVLGYLSYRFVEAPFRKKAFRDAPAARVVWAGVGSVTVLFLLGAFAAIPKWSLGYSPEVARLASFSDYRNSSDFGRQFLVGTCFLEDTNAYRKFDKAACLAKGPKKNYLVLGDSHAAHLWRALSEVYPDATVDQAAVSGCIPKNPADGSQTCKDMMADLFQKVIPDRKFDAIFLIARWTPDDLESLRATIPYLRRYTPDLIVCGRTIEYQGSTPRLLARAHAQGTTLRAKDLVPLKALDLDMKRQTSELGAKYVSIYDLACGDEPSGGCRELADDNQPMQFDSAHLTLSGARLVAKGIRAQIPVP